MRLRCPVCAAPLTEEDKRFFCGHGHSFDKAREVYVHLLSSRHMNSKIPGDNKEMVSARARFLSAGYYAPLAERLCVLCLDVGEGQRAAILDAGCGEGYYTQKIYDGMHLHGRPPDMLGVDISKAAVKLASRRLPQARFAVASVFELPVFDQTFDAVVNVSAPVCEGEVFRVLKPGGRAFFAIPSTRHLMGLKELIYDEPYENDVKDFAITGLCRLGIEKVRFRAVIDGADMLKSLFMMTPYYYRSPFGALEKLAAAERLETEVDFDIHIFEKDR